MYLFQIHLIAAVKRQPSSVSLDYTNIRPDQLTWLLKRLFDLKSLSLQNSSCSLVQSFQPSFPFLASLDLSWLSNFTHGHLSLLLTSPLSLKPGTRQNATRFPKLQQLKLAGTLVTDDSVKLISQHLKVLNLLDLSFCINISDSSIAYITKPLENITETDVPEDMQKPCDKTDTLKNNMEVDSEPLNHNCTIQTFPLQHLTTLSINNCVWISSDVASQSHRPSLTIYHCCD